MAKGKWHITKKRALAIAGIVVLIAAAAASGFVVRWIQTGSPLPQDNKANNSPAGEKLPPAVTDSQTQAANGNFDQANKTIQDALNQPSVSDDMKYQLLLQEGVNYTNQNMPQKAIDTLKQAEAIKSTYTTSHLIAEQYEILGDKANAIAYYKKTITQLDTKSPGFEDSKTDYSNRITALGGTP